MFKFCRNTLAFRDVKVHLGKRMQKGPLENTRGPLGLFMRFYGLVRDRCVGRAAPELATGVGRRLSLDGLGLGGSLGLCGRGLLGRRSGLLHGRRHRGSSRGGSLGRLLGARGLRRGILVTRRTALLGLDHGILVGGSGVGLLQLLTHLGHIGVPRLLARRGSVGATTYTLHALGLASLLQVLGNLLGGLTESLLQISNRRLDGTQLGAQLVQAGSGRGSGVGGGGGFSSGHFVLYLCRRYPLDRFFRVAPPPGWTFLEIAG